MNGTRSGILHERAETHTDFNKSDRMQWGREFCKPYWRFLPNPLRSFRLDARYSYFWWRISCDKTYRSCL